MGSGGFVCAPRCLCQVRVVEQLVVAVYLFHFLNVSRILFIYPVNLLCLDLPGFHVRGPERCKHTVDILVLNHNRAVDQMSPYLTRTTHTSRGRLLLAGVATPADAVLSCSWSREGDLCRAFSNLWSGAVEFTASVVTASVVTGFTEVAGSVAASFARVFLFAESEERSPPGSTGVGISSGASESVRRFGEVAPRFLLLVTVRENCLVVRDETTAERADTGDPSSLLRWRPTVKDVHLITDGIRKRDLGCAHPATRTPIASFRVRRDLVAEPEMLLLCPSTNHVPRPGDVRLWAYVREERHLVALPVQRGQGPAHPRSRPEQHEGDDEPDGETVVPGSVDGTRA